jgi:hypothetical protein
VGDGELNAGEVGLVQTLKNVKSGRSIVSMIELKCHGSLDRGSYLVDQLMGGWRRCRNSPCLALLRMQDRKPRCHIQLWVDNTLQRRNNFICVSSNI